HVGARCLPVRCVSTYRVSFPLSCLPPRVPASLFSGVLDSPDFLNGSSVWDNAEIGILRFPINPFCLCRPDSTVPLLHVEIVNSLSLATGRCVQALLHESSLLDVDSEFFFHLSSQSILQGLAGVHMTARDLYQSRIRNVVISPFLD